MMTKYSCRKYSLLTPLLAITLTGCGVKVSGKVDTSGTITHRLDITEAIALLREECEGDSGCVLERVAVCLENSASCQ